MITQTAHKDSVSTQDALIRFSNLFLPYVDQERFDVQLSISGDDGGFDIIHIHINQSLPELTPPFTIAEFYGEYRDRMLEAIVKTGEEIQRYQVSCEERVFRSHSARKLIEALASYDRAIQWQAHQTHSAN